MAKNNCDLSRISENHQKSLMGLHEIVFQSPRRQIGPGQVL